MCTDRAFVVRSEEDVYVFEVEHPGTSLSACQRSPMTTATPHEVLAST
jgi:hypothetical protein